MPENLEYASTGQVCAGVVGWIAMRETGWASWLGNKYVRGYEAVDRAKEANEVAISSDGWMLITQ